jgi:proteasome lid subunit RPN8/RPN11
MQSIIVNETLIHEIGAHGAETYPHECCGALLGVDNEEFREVRALHKLVNRRDDSPRNRFSVTSDDVRDADRVAQNSGLQVIGWYHSHPDHPALPSEYDREHAWPWYSYIIVSVMEGKPGAIASWRLTDDRKRFEPENISRKASAESEPQSHAASSNLNTTSPGGSK